MAVRPDMVAALTDDNAAQWENRPGGMLFVSETAYYGSLAVVGTGRAMTERKGIWESF